MLNQLKAKWVYFGLEAPIISWLIVIVLVVSMLGYWLYMYFRVFRPISRQIGSALRSLSIVAEPEEVAHNIGLEARRFDEIGQIFEQNTILKRSWQSFCKRLIRRPGERDDFFWSSESADETFKESTLIGSRLNITWCQSLPGFITGVGLLFTFIAILISLLAARLVNDGVQGIEFLLQGLLGKFLASIAALFLATNHLFVEKRFFQKLGNKCRQLAQTLDDLFPRLTLVHLFEDVRSQVAEQTHAIRSFNSNLAPALKASINEGVGPMLGRMGESVESLNQLLRQNEAQKQDSITDSVEKLLNELSASLAQTIDRMSETFTKNLSGSAQTQFTEIKGALSSTADLLKEMNLQFASTQNGMKELIELAKLSTAEQFREGRAQVESMSIKLEELMERMSERLESNADATTGAAKDILNRANSWSAQSAAQFEQMLGKYQQQVTKVEELRDAFTASLRDFTQAIATHSGMIRGLGETAYRVTETVNAVNKTMLGTQETQKAFEQIASQTRIQAEYLAKVNERQEEMWRNIQANLNRYAETFSQVEGAARALLREINDHLNNYTKATHNGFQNLVEMADNHFSNATNKLGASVNELDEVLSDLADTLGRTRQNGAR